ncbi:MAG: bifunctional diguanylate cyclase/phosphodiesterase [Acidimicrobiales bacterium]
MLRFADDGAHLIGLWAGGRFVRDPQIRIGNEHLPRGMPLRSSREPLTLAPEFFGAEFASLLRDLGDGQVLLIAPISDANQVTGAVAVLAPGDFTEEDRVALQLSGELLWRHVRHHDSRDELHERAEIAEILARVGARLHEGGLDEAGAMTADVVELAGGYVGADRIVIYERTASGVLAVVEWPPRDPRTSAGTVDFAETDWARIGQGPISWSELESDPVVSKIRGLHNAGLVVPGIVEGEVVGAWVLAKYDNRPFSRAHRELCVSIVDLLGQFRIRLRAEYALERRGLVEQCRTELAETFVNSSPSAVDAALAAALERIGGVFDARQVRWVEPSPDRAGSFVAIEWSDETDPDTPPVFRPTTLVLDPGGATEPFFLPSEDDADPNPEESALSTLVIPAVVGDRTCGALTLSDEGLSRALPPVELRALVDLAGLVHQARRRAHQEIEAEYRNRLDGLQLRLAHRFLDRTVVDDGPVLEWVLGEIGDALECDLIAFAEFVGSTEGEIHWWSRQDTHAEVAVAMSNRQATFDDHFRQCLEAGEPTVTRSRLLPEHVRQGAEIIAGDEFSMLLVPFRAPGIALMLGVCTLGDREWQTVETAMLQKVIGQVRQFIEVVASRRRLEYDATHDELTGLANRRRLHEEFAALVGAGRRGAMLMIDIDRFKVVNDSLGHSAGDAVLVALADRIRTSVRDCDLVGRFGGDEFAVVVPDGVGEMELAATADRLIEVIREPIVVRGTTIIPTCSIGIAVSGESDDVEAVLRHADAALYEAKAKGRDRYEFFDDARRQSLTDRLHLETALRSGVAAGEFEPWFQPEYDIETGLVVGVEALVRWHHPEKGIIEAGDFIEAAEEIGLAPELSRIVIAKSFAALEGWIVEGFDTRLRVNVAIAQLHSADVAAQLATALDAYGIPAERLCIEITERCLMLDPGSALEALEAVRGLGVEVAIDDFGTGLSSLARLKHLPVDTLKIDRTFVSGIVTNATHREIVRTIIGLARGLGLGVVAEGVEHVEQAELLLELGCRRAQGWLWSPALPAAEVPRLARV